MDVSFEYRARDFVPSSGRGAGSSGKSRLKAYYWFGSKKKIYISRGIGEKSILFNKI